MIGLVYGLLTVAAIVILTLAGIVVIDHLMHGER